MFPQHVFVALLDSTILIATFMPHVHTGNDPFGESAEEEGEGYAAMGGEEAADDVFPQELAATDAFPEQSPLDAPEELPEPAIEIPEQNLLTEWLGNWKNELEAKNAEHEQQVALVKQKAGEELTNFKLQQEKQREASQIKNRLGYDVFF